MELSVEGQLATFTFTSSGVLYTSWSNGLHSADCERCSSFIVTSSLDTVQVEHANHPCPIPETTEVDTRTAEQIAIDARYVYTGLETTPRVQ